MIWQIHQKCSRLVTPISVLFVGNHLHASFVQQKTPEISCITSSSLGTIVADIHGSVYILNREFEVAKSWVAHNGGRVTHMVEQKKMLITLGVRLVFSDASELFLL